MRKRIAEPVGPATRQSPLRRALLRAGLAAAASWVLPAAARADDDDPLHNVIDDGWATPQGYRFSGRLTEVRRVAGSASGRRLTLRRNLGLLATSGEEGQVRWNVGALAWQTRADDDGYWELQGNHALEHPQLRPGWHAISSEPPASSAASLLVHDERNRFGLISDIDDTIMISHVLDKRRLLLLSLTVPPEQRDAVAGMAALYQRLMQRNAQPGAAPVFYLSGGPRQLTDGTRRFLRANHFPPGALLLRELGSSQGDSLRDLVAYKAGRIRSILQAFPAVRFTLVGDDGEHDPEVYAQVQREFAHQVHAVWIRRVQPRPGRARYAGQADVLELLEDPRR